MSTSHFMKRLALAGLSAVGLAAAASGPGHAQPYGEYAGGGGGQLIVQAPVRYRINPFTNEGVVQESRAVYYGDLDLRADWGVRALHTRIVRAAVQVCRDLDYRVGAGAIDQDMDDCVRPAVLSAMAQSPAPGYLRYRYEHVGYVY